MQIRNNMNNLRAEVRRWRGYLFFLLGLGTWLFYIGLCERGGSSGALCQCCPVSLSPPLCLDAFETGREGMWLGEGKLRDEWLHVFELFLKHRVIFTPVCPALQDASKQSRSTALWLSGLIINASCRSVCGDFKTETHGKRNTINDEIHSIVRKDTSEKM